MTKLEYESEKVIAFKDINPVADVHILIVPRVHIPTFLDLGGGGREAIGEVVEVIKSLVKEKGIGGRYRVVCNGGSLQMVGHLHFHLLGGKWFKNQHDTN